MFEFLKAKKIKNELDLIFNNEYVAKIVVESKYQMTEEDIEKVFGTLENAHPGVRKEKERSPYRIGGKTNLLKTEVLQEALMLKLNIGK